MWQAFSVTAILVFGLLQRNMACHGKLWTILEKVEINDTLPLEAARRDSISNLTFGASNLSCCYKKKMNE